MHERILVRRWSDSMINTTDIMPFITRDPGCVAYGTALQTYTGQPLRHTLMATCVRATMSKT